MVTYRIATEPFPGDVRISRLYSYWYLNNESLIYPVFRRSFQTGQMKLESNFDQTGTITQCIEQEFDKLTLLSAYNISTWQCEVVVQIN